MDIREVTPAEEEENRYKQSIMAKRGINVKVDGSWGPWQQGQWEKLQFQFSRERDQRLKNFRKLELYLGILFIIPAFIGVCSFILCFFDFHSEFADMRNLRGDWTDSEYATSPAPIFIGVMAIAGAILLVDYINSIKKAE